MAQPTMPGAVRGSSWGRGFFVFFGVLFLLVASIIFYGLAGPNICYAKTDVHHTNPHPCVTISEGLNYLALSIPFLTVAAIITVFNYRRRKVPQTIGS